MFWLTNLLHLALCFIGGRFDIMEKVDAENGTKVWEEWHPVDLIEVDWASTLVGMPLLFFFIVFYNNNSYNRFYQLYGHCVGMGGRCMEWTYLIKAHSLPEDRAGQWNSVGMSTTCHMSLVTTSRSRVVVALLGEAAAI